MAETDRQRLRLSVLNWQFTCRNNAGRLKKVDVPFFNNTAHDNSVRLTIFQLSSVPIILDETGVPLRPGPAPAAAVYDDLLNSY